MKPKITLYQDTRRKKTSGLYPIKIRVWDRHSGEARLYPTDYDLSINDFNSAWVTKKTPRAFEELNKELEKVKQKAVTVAEAKEGHVFAELDRKLYRPNGAGQNIFYHYEEAITKLTTEERIGTASSYRLAKKSLVQFLKHLRKSGETLLFTQIDADWLESYEKHMVDTGRSRTTVGVYLRTLRAIFNTAIEMSDIEKDLYPFGRRKYVIPAGRRTKKALNKEQLTALFNAEPVNNHQERARDFFFFTYSCNGMNMKDIALLQFSDMANDAFTFYRAKTFRTTKDNLIPITVYLNEFSSKIISKYGNDPTDGPYVFPILNGVDDATGRQRKIQAFTRSINQHLKKLAIASHLPKEISSIWARHSFATLARRSGKTNAFVQESFGHTDEKITQSYFAGFEDSVKKEFAQTLMDF